MTRLARWCFTRRRTVLAAWLLLLVVALGTARVAGGAFNSSLSLPGTDSQAAVSLLTQHYPAAAGETDQVVIQATGGATVGSPQVRDAVTRALARVSAVPGIASVASPYAAAGASQVSGDGTVAFARVSWDKQPDQVTAADADALITAARSADGPSVHVSLGGASITNSERAKPGPSVAVGVVAALAVLLIVFGGAVLSALTPLAGAALALVIGSAAITLLSHGLTVASASTDLAVLIGLGVGVDYGLFIVSRHRAAVRAGRSYEDAAAEAVNTSGRTVLFAGLTVCLALLGQFALGVSFLDGLSAAAAVTVALTIATALTLLPALLGFLGPRVLSRRERAALAGNGPVRENPRAIGWRWARLVERHSLLTALASLAAITLIALPVAGLRLGTSDASTDPASWTTHQSYAALAHGFGPGFNGPLRAGRPGQPPRRPDRVQPAARDRGADAGGRQRHAAAGLPRPARGARHPLSGHRAAGPADHHARQHAARQPDPPGRARQQPRRARRRPDSHRDRLRARPRQQATAVRRRRRHPGVHPARRGIPQPAHPAGRLGAQPDLGSRGARRHHRRVHQGLGFLTARPVRHRARGRVPARRHVLGPVRPVDGLRGLHRKPHAGRMAAPALTAPETQPGATTPPSPPGKPTAPASSPPPPGS